MERGFVPAVRVVVLTTALCVLAGCADQRGGEEREPPRLGAADPASATSPSEPMDSVEVPVTERLSKQLADDGLRLDYVDCPRWDGELPASLHCEGYVDGVVGTVRVELTDDDGTVEYDARLEGGVVATTRLVRSLELQGMRDVDCGDTPAYPARVGMEIVCRVHEGDAASYVVATVVDRSGAVEIEDY